MHLKMKKSYMIIFMVILGILTPMSSSSKLYASEPIKIGFFSAETEASLRFYSPWSRQGFELGIKYASDNTNATNEGRPYELIYYDTKGLVSDAKALVKAAIDQDGVDILVGGTYTTVAKEISILAEENEKLYFIAPAAGADLTGKDFNPYTFRIARNNWHDALAGVQYAMDTLNATKFGFIAADYSFGYNGVETMTKVITKNNGSVVLAQYAPLTTTDFTPYLENILNAKESLGIDFLYVIWSGTFSYLYNSLANMNVTQEISVGGAVIDLYSINLIEDSLQPYNLTLEGGTGFCLYSYDLPQNPVNNWLVNEYTEHDITPTSGVTYRVPELFTASAFATAQFICNVTNAVPDLDVIDMIYHLESNLTIETPKGPTRLRPEDHQGLAEMYIAEIWKDDRIGSETYGLMVPRLISTLSAEEVAPPIENNYKPLSLTRIDKNTNIGIYGLVIGLLVIVVKRRKVY